MDLSVSLIQSDLHWQDPDANLAFFSKEIKALEGKSKLIILPEMFSTGFTMDAASHAEKMEGKTMLWMETQASESRAAILGSLIIEEAGFYYNRLIWMYPGGMYHTYDKRHLFAMAGENHSYAAGSERLVVTYKGWRICPLICYDLRFPVWSRNDVDFDLLIYIANWPDKRSYDWLTLLKARAIENQAYVIGVNRVGTDNNGHTYNGDSCIIDPGWKKTLFHHEKSPLTYTTSLSANHLKEVRSKLPFLADQDKFKIM